MCKNFQCKEGTDEASWTNKEYAHDEDGDEHE
jgi:hypothetical protein